MSDSEISWTSLIQEFEVNLCKIIPVSSYVEITSLFDSLHNTEYLRRRFSLECGGYLDHETRIFIIQSEKNKSIAIISWIGRRGCRWHVIDHIAINRQKPIRKHIKIAQDLAEKYQVAWTIHGQ